MKTLLWILALTAALNAPANSTQNCEPAPAPNLYAAPATVSELDFTSDSVTVIDRQGEAWMFYGIEEWNVGDECVCIFSDNATPEIEDDLILAVQPAFPI